MESGRVSYPHLAVAIETSQGAAIEQLLESGVIIYPVNPKSAERYRDRKAPSGTKTDFLDAWSLADALRVDGHGWRALKPLDPLIQELRLLCRDEVELIGKRTELVNQLQAALHEYYPAALQAFEDWTASPSWSFVQQFPTPELLRQAGRRQWQTFLQVHRLYRPELNERRLEIFGKAHEFCGPAAVTRAKSRLALTLSSCYKPWSSNCKITAKKFSGSSRSIRTMTCLARCPGPVRNWLPDCSVSWARIARSSTVPRRCNVM